MEFVEEETDKKNDPRSEEEFDRKQASRYQFFGLRDPQPSPYIISATFDGKYTDVYVDDLKKVAINLFQDYSLQDESSNAEEDSDEPEMGTSQYYKVVVAKNKPAIIPFEHEDGCEYDDFAVESHGPLNSLSTTKADEKKERELKRAKITSQSEVSEPIKIEPVGAYSGSKKIKLIGVNLRNEQDKTQRQFTKAGGYSMEEFKTKDDFLNACFF